MTLIFYKSAAAFLIFLVGLLTALYPLIKRLHSGHNHSFELGEAFASGVFLGVAFMHMLPHAIAEFNVLYPQSSFPFPEVICVGGFVLMMFLERLSFLQRSFSPGAAMPYLLSLILAIHALTEGAALGFGQSFAESLFLFIAIIAHKGSESFALCIALIRYEISYVRIALIITLFALMTPMGIGIGAILNLFANSSGKLIEIIFNSFAAGTFLYISTLHHVHFHERAPCVEGIREFLFLLLGLAVMTMIAVVA